jgi:glutathione S-transferase
MVRLYDNLGSGNGYKVRLLLRQLGIPFERIEVDIYAGESRTPEFLRMNPLGRIPVLEHAPGRYLAESGAILWFLAEGTPFLPEDKLLRAQVLGWMFFEQNSHESSIAVVRNWKLHFEITGDMRVQLIRLEANGYAALDAMERHLAQAPYFVGGTYGIADIALYAYTHVAHEGGFDLGRYAAIRAWLKRVRGQPGHTPITQP